MFELANVARPVVHQQRVSSRGRQLKISHRSVALEEVAGELANVFSSCLRRRHLHVQTVQPVIKVQPESPQLDQPRERALGRRLIRVSTRRVPRTPTRSMDKSWMARRSLARAAGDRSDTSSRKSVPSWACSNFPRRLRTPVAVRSSIPKSSASSRVSTIAAQLTATKWPLRRRKLVNLPGDELLARARFTLVATLVEHCGSR